MDFGSIYKITCLENNRIYIGQTKNKNERFKQHLYLLKLSKHYNKYLQEDYDKFGKSKFSYEIIEDNIDINNLLNRETYWINYYGGIENISTYNMLDNFTENNEMREAISVTLKNRIPWNKGIPCTIERKSKLSNSYKNLSESRKLEISNKIKDALKTSHPWKDKHHTQESKLKMSLAKKNMYNGENNPNFGNIKYDQDFIEQLYNDYIKFNNYNAVGRIYNMTGDSVRYYIKRYVKG